MTRYPTRIIFFTLLLLYTCSKEANDISRSPIEIPEDNIIAKIGDKIMIMSSAGIQTIIGDLPKQQTFIINSIFDSGLADFDRNISFINIKTLENFFNLFLC